MRQMDQRNEQLLGRLWETSGMKEWWDSSEMLEHSRDRLAADDAAELDPIDGADQVVTQLHTDVFGVPHVYLGEPMTLDEAATKIFSNDPAKMHVAFSAISDSPEHYVSSTSADEVRALVEKILIIADSHKQRDIRIAAAECAGDLIGRLRYPTLWEPKD